MAVLVATDFFTAEVWTRCGLLTYSILPWDTPSHCTPEDVDTLLQAIDQGKRPVRFAGIFDQEEKPR